ncbi:Protein of unknown function [Lactobacillus delbrueckii subsp. lactis]|nr:Protein of unknown function [Lactobacillus delbrueckii subsp. lactis]
MAKDIAVKIPKIQTNSE